MTDEADHKAVAALAAQSTRAAIQRAGGMIASYYAEPFIPIIVNDVLESLKSAGYEIRKIESSDRADR